MSRPVPVTGNEVDQGFADPLRLEIVIRILGEATQIHETKIGTHIRIVTRVRFTAVIKTSPHKPAHHEGMFGDRIPGFPRPIIIGRIPAAEIGCGIPRVDAADTQPATGNFAAYHRHLRVQGMELGIEMGLVIDPL